MDIEQQEKDWAERKRLVIDQFLNASPPSNNELAEAQSAWDAWEKIDRRKDEIAQLEKLKQTAATTSEFMQAKQELINLRQELKQLLALVAPASAVDESVPVPIGKKRWTPEAIAELAAYRATHGTKKAAEHFGVSEAFVRKLLPSKTPPPKGYSAFNPRNQ